MTGDARTRATSRTTPAAWLLGYVLGRAAPADAVDRLLERMADAPDLPGRLPALGWAGRFTLRVCEPVLRRRSPAWRAWLDAATLVAEATPEGARVFYALPNRHDARGSALGAAVVAAGAILEIPAFVAARLVRRRAARG
ncbi:hypothetical protein ACTZWW_10530 [Salinarimonas sp. NSM]|uniref:hypothetical protein n=1 Tax=Salinarimonas sp. NSM TaxID=3458003 RepID=UPI004036A7F8